MIDKFWPTVEVPRLVAMVFIKLTAFAPLLFNETAPVKLFALFNVIVVPAVNEDVPGTTNPPLWAIANPAVAVKLPPLVSVRAGKLIEVLLNVINKLRKLVTPVKLGKMADAFVFLKLKSRIFVKVPPKLIAPVKLLAWLARKISEFGVVNVKLVVPGTVIAPVCVIVPKEESVKLPPFVNVIVGKVIAAASNLKLTFLKLESPVKLGTFALGLILRNRKSRIFVKVPPNMTVPVKLFACVFKVMFVAAFVAANVVVPGTVITPVWVIAPPEVIDKFCPTVEVPKLVAMLLTKLTEFAPLFCKNTLPVKTLFALFKVIVVPALNVAVLAVPVSVIGKVLCVIPAAEVAFKFPANVTSLKMMLAESTKVTLFALIMLIHPKSLLTLLSVISFAAPAVKYMT